MKFVHSLKTLMILSPFLCIPPVSGAELRVSDPERAGLITHPELTEISGLAVSLKQPDILWVINDSGNSPTLYAVTTSGEFRAAFPVSSAVNRDWEDLSSFLWDGKPCLLIADVGDNDAVRKTCALYFVEEPDLDHSGDAGGPVVPFRTLTFRYEDGPRDCEAVAVDVENRRILLLSKRTDFPGLYVLPLDGTDPGVRTAKKVADLTNVPRFTEEQKSRNPLLRFAGMPTAMDLSGTSGLAVVLTYTEIWIFVNTTSGWIGTLRQRPVTASLPLLRQAESVCFDGTGRTIYITSERLPAPLIRFRIGLGEENGLR
ncbi:MAG TPA: hypothetical protein ENN17_07045 [bacterium]|nr:hypothetical protein [bacterium]